MTLLEQLTREQITRAKELLQTAKHGCMATINEDDTPHATPLYLLLNKDLTRFYFASYPKSLHSRNVVRTGNMFVVVYDMVEKGGLYIKAVNGSLQSGKDLTEALIVHNAARARDGKEPLGQGYFEGEGPQRMYGADITNFYVNLTERDVNGSISKEWRHEIRATDLLA